MDLGLTRDEWMETGLAVLLALGALTIAYLIAALLARITHAVMHSTETALDDHIAAALRRPVVFVVGVWAVIGSIETLSYIGDSSVWLTRTAVGLTVLAVTVTVRRILVILLEWQAARPGSNGKLHPGSLPLIRRGITLLVFAAGFLIILDTLGLEISPLLAGLGIGGLAVALALQPLLGNVFASSYMLSDSSVRIGDFIEMQDGPVGIVDDIGWRATRIRSFDNNVVIVPNSTLADATVTNYTLSSLEADARVVVGVAYEEDLERVEAVCREILTTLRDEWATSVKEHEPVISFTGFGDSNIDVLLKVRAQTWGDSFPLRHEMVKRIHARFVAEGIVINYPARRVFLDPEDTRGLGQIGGSLPTMNGAEPAPEGASEA